MGKAKAERNGHDTRAAGAETVRDTSSALRKFLEFHLIPATYLSQSIFTLVE